MIMYFSFPRVTKHPDSRHYIPPPHDRAIIHHQNNFSPPKYAGRPNEKDNNPMGKPELYDLIKGPHEKRNLAMTQPEIVTELNRDLNAWRDGSPPKK